MRVQVLNNCQGPFYVQLPHPRGTDSRINGVGEHINLQPGINLVDAETWGHAKKNPTIAFLLKDKVPFTKASEADASKFGQPKLKVGERVLSDTNPFVDKDGKELSIDEAKGMISLTQDTDYLSSWLLAQKPGSEITKAINERIKEIASGIEPQAA